MIVTVVARSAPASGAARRRRPPCGCARCAAAPCTVSAAMVDADLALDAAGTKSRTARVAVSYRRRLTRQGYGCRVARRIRQSALVTHDQRGGDRRPRPHRGRSGPARRSSSPTPTPERRTAADRAASASARRGPIRGPLPITCTDDVADREAGRRAPAGPPRASMSTPRRAGPRGSVGAEDRAEVARARPRTAARRRQACAATSPSECPTQPAGSSGQLEAGHPIGRPASKRVDVDADADARQRPASVIAHPPGRRATASASTRSSGRVTLNASSDPATTMTRPAAALDEPGVVGGCRCSATGRRCAASSTARRKPCGVCTARSAARSTVSVTAVARRPA